MSNTYILIHGAWHAKWCWEKIAYLLQRDGHHVIVPDLPGHGTDQTPFKKIHLNTYFDFVNNIIQALPGKVILVGHSMAGMVITQIATNCPEKIEKLIYIAAYLPESGESIIDINKQLLATDSLFDVEIDNKAKSICVHKDSEKIFYNRCSVIDAAYYAQLVQAEPAHPFLNKLVFAKGGLAKIKKIYVSCLFDNALPFSAQQHMAVRGNCFQVSLPADHSPFFSTPAKLFELLVQN